MEQLAKFAPLIGRILIGGLFLMAGLGKAMGDMSQFAGYIEMGGLPGLLAWPATLFEIALGAAMLAGFQTRLAALAGAAFCLATAVFYHNNFADQMQMTIFLKNLAIAGGFLMYFAHGAGAYAVDK